MKKTLLFKLFTFSFLLFASIGWVKGQALLVENFDYSIGALLTANGWTNHSGTSGFIDVTTGLSFAGYIGSDIGGAANLNENGEDVNRQFTEQTSGNIYVSFVIQTEATNSAGYFLHLSTSPMNSSFYFSKVWVNATGDGVNIGSSTAPTSYIAITPGTPTLLVIKLEYATGISSLYVFNTFPTSEPTTADATFTETVVYTNVGSIAMRQFNAAQKVIVDGIRVATTWDEAVKPSASTPVATDLFFSEYLEGSTGNDRALEIFNGTGADVDLSAYTVKQSYGGEGWGIRGGVAMIEYVLPLSGMLANGDVFVIYNAETTNPAIIAAGDLGLTYAAGTAGCRNASFTGNDPMGLFKGDVLIDAVGIELSTTGPWAVAGITGATQDHTLVRKNTITEGTTDWAVSAGTNAEDAEWVVYDVNFLDDLGMHTFGVVADVTPPTFIAKPNNGDTEVAIDTKIVLTFDEAIRNIDDSEITDTNVAALLTFKETDATGADVAFTATIDAAKKVITVTPSAVLAIGQVYYGAIAPVEDTSNNATSESSMTFTTITKYDVTFNVDMSLVEGFDPLTDTVYIAGNLAGWVEPGKNLDLQMTDPDGNMIYTIILGVDLTAVPVVADIAYKFFINAGWNTWGEWVGDPNRTATITGNTTLNAIFGNKGGEPVLVNVPFIQDFEYSTANANMSLAGWTNANVETGGTALWGSKLFSLNKYGQVTSFGATSTGADQIWLITPGIIMPANVIADLTFDVNVGYWTHEGFSVMISTDFDQTVGGITTATWTDVTREFIIPSAPASGYGVFTNAGHLDVSAYTGNMYVAFVYNGNKTTTLTTTYQIDNVAVNVLGYVGLNKLPKSEVNIYPNPSNGRLLISNPSNETQEIAVFNSLGKQVKYAVSAKGIISLDITSQSKGFYLVRITNKANKSVQYKKIVLN